MVPVHSDCAHFRGNTPCAYGRTCARCPHYHRWEKQVLVIKLGAMGDVLRTTPILTRLKKPHTRLLWLTDEPSVPLLAHTPHIDRVLVHSPGTIQFLSAHRFDALYNFDKNALACAAATILPAAKKYGFLLNRFGALVAATAASEYALRLGVDDTLKFHTNKKNYQEILFGMIGARFAGEPYQYTVHPEERSFVREYLSKRGIPLRERVIGINTGSGDAQALKQWTTEGFSAVARGLAADKKTTVLLLGGPKEDVRNKSIERNVPGIYYPGSFQSVRQFAALIAHCDVVLTGDTLALHLALALMRRVVALFGPTSAAEVHLYGLGTKIVSPIDCAPCYKQTCAKKDTCMTRIDARDVFSACKRLLALTQR